MASILFLGYSNLLKARILPILSKAGFTSVGIAKYSGQEWDEEYKKCDIPVTCYDSYEEGLKHFQGVLVYVSTVNSTHIAYATAALNAGFHVIIDKPAAESYENAKRLVEMAREKHLFVGESTVYLEHPQFDTVKQIFSDNNDAPKLLTVHFTMPPFQPNNFRYQKSLGGGAIMDTAPYAVSVARYFLGGEPEQVSCVVNERQADGLDIEYSLLMQYPDGKAMIGHFGFNTEYINQVFLLGNRTNVTINRIFTIPDTLENEIQVTHMNEQSIVKAPAGNNFELYLCRTLQTLSTDNYEAAYEALLSDAKVKQMIFENIQ